MPLCNARNAQMSPIYCPRQAARVDKTFNEQLMAIRDQLSGDMNSASPEHVFDTGLRERLG
jgi:hypothetical protein